jgi:hypothetical protein
MARMTRSARRRFPVNRVGLGLAVGAALALAGCGSSAPTPSPSRSTPPAISTAPSAVSPSASAASQTDTPWGRIWDTLPGGFPVIAGSTPSEEAATGPASAIFAVEGNTAKRIATSMQAALEAAGFRTEGLSGPLEDGAYVLDAAGTPAGCKVQVTAAPLGGLTTVTVMYGAACPHG